MEIVIRKIVNKERKRINKGIEKEWEKQYNIIVFH